MPYTDAINKRRRCAMSTEEAKRRAKKNSLQKTGGDYLPRACWTKSRIQEHAKSQGESTNAFIYRAVNEAIERDEKKADREE